MSAAAELARLGSATVYEAAGRAGLVDLDLHQIVPGSRVAGRARPVLCAQDDNLMVHAAIAHAEPGDVLVFTMPAPRPVALIGDLLCTQARERGVAGMLVDGSVRDVEDLADIGLPIWARWIRVRGAVKQTPGSLDEPIVVGGQQIVLGDVVVMDADGVAVVAADRIEEVVAAAREREEREAIKREKLRGGALSYDLDGLRALVETR